MTGRKPLKQHRDRVNISDESTKVYVDMALGYVRPDDRNRFPMVMRLLKSPYELRENPTNWLWMVDEHLGEIGSDYLKSDLHVYIYSEGSTIFILTVYVDDILLLGKPPRCSIRSSRS